MAERPLPFHHHDFTSHEVMDVWAGAPPRGPDGDVTVLPAGTGYRLLASSSDFRVAGAYP